MSNLYVPQLVAPSFTLQWGVAFASPLVDLLTFVTVWPTETIISADHLCLKRCCYLPNSMHSGAHCSVLTNDLPRYLVAYSSKWKILVILQGE